MRHSEPNATQRTECDTANRMRHSEPNGTWQSGAARVRKLVKIRAFCLGSAAAHRLDHFPGCTFYTTRINRGLWCVLERELNRFSYALTGEILRDTERQVNSRRNPCRRSRFSVNHDTT